MTRNVQQIQNLFICELLAKGISVADLHRQDERIQWIASLHNNQCTVTIPDVPQTLFYSNDSDFGRKKQSMLLFDSSQFWVR